MGRQLEMFGQPTKSQENKSGPQLDPRDLLLLRLDGMERRLDIALYILDASKRRNSGSG